MVDLSHLEFYGSNNGVFEKPMYDFLYVVNRDHSSKLLSFEKIAFLHFGIKIEHGGSPPSWILGVQ